MRVDCLAWFEFLLELIHLLGHISSPVWTWLIFSNMIDFIFTLANMSLYHAIILYFYAKVSPTSRKKILEKSNNTFSIDSLPLGKPFRKIIQQILILTLGIRWRLNIFKFSIKHFILIVLFVWGNSVVPTNGSTQVSLSPLLWIPRFQILPNDYSLLFSWLSLDGHLADGGLLMSRWCQNIRWCAGICVHFVF